MLKNELNLSDIFDFFKKNQVKTFDEEIDEFGGFFITASIIAAIVVSPDPISKITAFSTGVGISTFKVSTLLSWLPDKFKYKNRGRDMIAIKRYELSSHINLILLQIAIKNAVKEIIMPQLESILKEIKLDENQKSSLTTHCELVDQERNNISLSPYGAFSVEDFSIPALKLVDPLLSLLYNEVDKCKESKPSLKKIDPVKTRERYLENINTQYQAYLIHCASEFPEFSLWADLSLKSKIIKEIRAISKKQDSNNKATIGQFLSKIEEVSSQIEELKNKQFIAESGFPSFIQRYTELFKIQTDFLINSLRNRVSENIDAHHNEIRKELSRLLSSNKDVEDIVYPKNKDIYIAQSFESITYKRREHRKGFLTADSLGDKVDKGENIGNFLLECLADPVSIHKPIVLLGNPGAGKSMLSKMFAALLCDTTDYIPFLIKLRTVASSSTSISEHINKGLSNSIESSTEINWIDWAKEFKDRMPVIVMDGFDELMQTSNRELNGYVEAIREFQERALSSNVCVRIILTSRITVMQDVAIPEGTRIVKLDSFDDKRRSLWIEKWNSVQVKGHYKFALPDNEKIVLLAKEPLLMFMLAVYDFENSELQRIANDKTFNQSKLYDSLLNKFITRQLEKDDRYRHTNKQNQIKEDEIFRLRLGLIALMMFMNDTTSRDTQKLYEEMSAFGIQHSTFQSDNIVGGFFFIHENKSVTGNNVEKFNYEFLHKTFGEFLTADFLLRIAVKQYNRVIDNSDEIVARKETFQFSFGYNWLHKHHNILNFLFEHGKQLIIPASSEHRFIINNIIKGDLKDLFEKIHLSFPVSDIRLLEKKPIIDHLSIYSQNLVFLWLAICENDSSVAFDLFARGNDQTNMSLDSKYESQDRDEIDLNKAHWKRIARLWTLTGNHKATARLKEWVQVSETQSNIVLTRKKSDIVHSFSDAAAVACNDFEWLLSYFDNEYKVSPDAVFLDKVSIIIKNKPELTTLAVDAVLHRFNDVYQLIGSELFIFLTRYYLTRRQQITFLRKVGHLRATENSIEIDRMLLNVLKDIFRVIQDNPVANIELLKILAEFKTFSFSKILPYDGLELVLQNLTREIDYIASDSPFVALDYLKVLHKFTRHHAVRWRFRSDMFEETIFRLSKDFPHLLIGTPYISYEYLKLLNEFRQHYPMNRKVSVRIYEEILHRLPSDINYLLSQNPGALIEYLKLVLDLRSQTKVNVRHFEEHIGRVLREISERFDEFLNFARHDFYDFLKVLSNIDTTVQINRFFNHSQIEYLILRLVEDLLFTIRDNPRRAIEHIKILRNYNNYIPYEKITSANRNLFGELTSRIEKFIWEDKKHIEQTLFLYVELMLVLSYPHTIASTFELIDSIVNKINRDVSEKGSILRMTALLIKYKLPIEYIERLMMQTPMLLSVFLSSPELGQQIIDAQLEIGSYERHY